MSSVYDNNNNGALTETLDNECKGVEDLVGKLPKDHFVLLSNPFFFHLKLLFNKERLKNQLYWNILQREMNAFKLLKDLFYFPQIDNKFHPEFQEYKLYDFSKLLPFGKRFFKGRWKKLLGKFEEELIDIKSEAREIIKELMEMLKKYEWISWTVRCFFKGI